MSIYRGYKNEAEHTYCMAAKDAYDAASSAGMLAGAAHFVAVAKKSNMKTLWTGIIGDSLEALASESSLEGIAKHSVAIFRALMKAADSRNLDT